MYNDDDVEKLLCEIHPIIKNPLTIRDIKRPVPKVLMNKVRKLDKTLKDNSISESLIWMHAWLTRMVD